MTNAQTPRERMTKVADAALTKRLSYASLHWGTEKVSPEAWPHLIDAIVSALADAGLVGKESEAKAQALDDFDTADFASTMGGDASWLTTATKVANLFRLWLDDEAAKYREHHA